MLDINMATAKVSVPADWKLQAWLDIVTPAYCRGRQQ